MRQPILYSALALLLLAGCKESSFSSGGGGKTAPAKVAKVEKPSKDAVPKADSETPLGNKTGPEQGADVATTGGTPSVAPTEAVTVGSFTAWADPANPAERQDYTIFIEVKLPSNGSPLSYTKEDLSGLLIGTDGYTQAIEQSFAPIQMATLPFDVPFQPSSQPTFDPKGQFVVNGNIAKISFMVPGADRKVQDTIQIRSKLLNESQTVSLVFQ